MTVDTANMRSANAHDGVFHSRTRLILGRFHRFLNGRNRFIQVYDHTLARASRFRHAVAAIAQSAIGDLNHERTGFRAAYVNRG